MKCSCYWPQIVCCSEDGAYCWCLCGGEVDMKQVKAEEQVIIPLSQAERES
jgi:hypothetical protein